MDREVPKCYTCRYFRDKKGPYSDGWWGICSNGEKARDTVRGHNVVKNMELNVREDSSCDEWKKINLGTSSLKID